jgi:hypothetical protein
MVSSASPQDKNFCQTLEHLPYLKIFENLLTADVIVCPKRDSDIFIPGRQWISAISSELLTVPGGKQFATAPTDILLKEQQ